MVMFAPSGIATVGRPQVINCMAITVNGVESSFVMISWIGPGGNNITNNSRVIISSTISNGNTHTSRLQFAYLMEEDEGNYTCSVTILDTIGSQSSELGPLISKLCALFNTENWC